MRDSGGAEARAAGRVPSLASVCFDRKKRQPGQRVSSFSCFVREKESKTQSGQKKTKRDVKPNRRKRWRAVPLRLHLGVFQLTTTDTF